VFEAVYIVKLTGVNGILINNLVEKTNPKFLKKSYFCNINLRFEQTSVLIEFLVSFVRMYHGF